MKRLLLVSMLTALGCSSPRAEHTAPTASAIVHARLSLEESALRRDERGFRRLVGGDFVIAPATADAPLRFALGASSVEIVPEGLAASAGREDHGVIVYDHAAPATDLVHVLSRAGAEELRVLRDPSAPTVMRYRVLRDGAPARVRISPESARAPIEIVDESGRVLLASAPPFAIDARGVRRDLSARTIGGDRFELTLDVTGLAFPIVVDPAWTAVPSMASERSDFAMVKLSDGRVLAIGGWGTGGAQRTCEIYDPAKNTWTATGAMITNRGGHVAARLSSGKVLAWAGTTSTSTSTSVISSAEVFDPATGRWTATAASPTLPFTPLLAALNDGRALAISGDSSSNAAYVWSPTTGAWTTVTKPTAGTAALVTLSTGEVLRISASDSLAADQLFDPTTLRWTTVGTRKEARDGFTAILLPGDRVLVAGGRSYGFGGVALATAELYTHATKSWTSVSAMKVARDLPFGAPLGKLAMVGGGSTADAELFDPTTNVFQPGSSMALTTPRRSAPAVAIAANQILVAGGIVASASTSSAELFVAVPPGNACTASGDCATGFCVDGVCCDRACNEQCEACDVSGAVGTCTAVSGKPHGLRPRCPSGGTNVCATKTCDGKTTTECAAFPGASTKCSPASCDGSSYTAQGTCDGTGVCSPGATTGCRKFSCDSAGCKTACTTRADCAGGLVCVAGACSKTGVCSDDGLSSRAENGEQLACAPYRCEDATGVCAKACAASGDCAPGFACDVASATCVSAGSADPGDGGCAVSASPRESPLAWIVAVGLAVGSAVRTRARDRRLKWR